MSAATAKTQDPSMEEILASIRRIIADDGDAPKDRPQGANDARHPGDPDDVLDLADVPGARVGGAPLGAPDLDVELPDLSFVETATAEPIPAAPAAIAPSRPREPVPEPSEPPPATLAPAPAAAPPAGLDQLVSTATTASVSHAFNILSHTILTQNARTLEDLVRDMLKPMLKVWLDDNLPPLVERLVRAEIERVARGSR